MKKKSYIAPVIREIILHSEPIMQITSTPTENAGVGNKPVGGDTPDLIKGRREWGGLWE